MQEEMYPAAGIDRKKKSDTIFHPSIHNPFNISPCTTNKHKDTTLIINLIILS